MGLILPVECDSIKKEPASLQEKRETKADRKKDFGFWTGAKTVSG